MNYLEQTLAQLACDIPGATRVFLDILLAVNDEDSYCD